MIRGFLKSSLLLMTICGITRAQFSPGELARVHEQLEGVDNCTQCHEQGKEITGAKCLACHTEIRDAINSRHGMHFRNSSAGCVSCHKEHLGRTARITQFDQAAFDHGKTGYLLTGKHRTISCRSCHDANRITNSIVLQSLIQHPRQTYLGVQENCVACHADRHGRTLGELCGNCHGSESWKPAAAFDHAKARFPLQGKHAAVVCLKCHEASRMREAARPLLFTSKKFEDCTPCHASPHGESLARQSCRTCHDVDGWSMVQTFDHSKTGYALVGKHAAVSCTKCHTNLPGHLKAGKTEFATRPFRDCAPCHTSPHAKSFSQKACSVCHTPVQWSKIPEKAFDHSLTSFPLRGAHAVIACEKCHRATAQTTFAQAFKLEKKACRDCHEDFHKGRFTRDYANDCSRCHAEDSYSPSTYSVARHATSRFTLTGAHAAVPCRDCHLKEKQLVFHWDEFACTACHTDPHNNRFAGFMKARGCEACHRTSAWNVMRFDHAQTEFPLIGRHESVPCEKCHKKPGPSSVAEYTGTTRECSGCHKDPHAGQFTERGIIPCEKCHSATAWTTLLFRHNVQSSFLLTGAHEKVQCRGCHKVERIRDVLIVRYKPVDGKCETCHPRS